MENTALLIAMGIIIFLLLILIYVLTRQKTHIKENHENTQNANTPNHKDINYENEKLNDIIAEQKQEIANIKNENKEYDRKLKNYESNIPIISKIEKDNSDLLFFYREFIHNMAYINPIRCYIKTFSDDLDKIDEKLEPKDKVNMFGECLKKIDLSNQTQELAGYIKVIADGLRDSISGIDEKSQHINKKQNEIFHRKVLDCTTKIIETRLADIERIEALHKILIENYDKWKNILTRSKLVEMIMGFFRGISEGIISQTYGVIGDVFNMWSGSNTLKDDDFVKLYNGTAEKIIEESVSLTQALDMDLTVIEILYQEHKEKEYSSLFKEIQNSLFSGKDLNDLYSNWRKAQHNEIITPTIGECIIEKLQAKNLDKNTIDNIKEMVC
jgi:hypothetical protein